MPICVRLSDSDSSSLQMNFALRAVSSSGFASQLARRESLPLQPSQHPAIGADNKGAVLQSTDTIFA